MQCINLFCHPRSAYWANMITHVSQDIACLRSWKLNEKVAYKRGVAGHKNVTGS